MGLSVSIFGLGYVGSVSAACFASMGHKVIGVDVSRAKVEMMDSGRTPIIEARMSEMVAEAHRAGFLHATTGATAAVLNSEVSFVCVGTPSLKNGKLDLSRIESVAREISATIRQKKSPHVFVLRSTVLPGPPKPSYCPSSKEEGADSPKSPDFTVCYPFPTHAQRQHSRRLPVTALRPHPRSPATPDHLAPLHELCRNTPGGAFVAGVAGVVLFFRISYPRD